MKEILIKCFILLLVLTCYNCDLAVPGEDGKETCVDDFIAKAGKNRSNLESEAQSRGIDASDLILEISNTLTSSSEKIFDCSATEDYSKLSEVTSGQFIKSESPKKAIQEVVKYTGSMTQDSIDLVFLIDATGSMGDYIEEVKNSLSSIIDSLSGKEVNISIAVFRDKNVDSIWYERNPGNLLQADNKEISTFLANVKADGGGDLPESLYDGAWKTISELNWKAQGRTFIILTDAPPLAEDKTKYTIDNVINICTEKRVVPLIILVSLT